MFQRFTDRARRVAVLAQEQARLLKHDSIGTEHLLLGIVQEGESVAAVALDSLGISADAVRKQVEEVSGPGEQAPSGHIPFTPQATKVLELTLSEARELGHDYIAPEHILLGLVSQGDDVAVQVLVSLGAGADRVRSEVIELMTGRQDEDVPDGPWQGERASAGLHAEVARLRALLREHGIDPDDDAA